MDQRDQHDSGTAGRVQHRGWARRAGGGHPGWELMADIYVQHDAAGVPGDTVDIVVVDTGRPGSLSIFTSEVIIGDPDRAPLVDAARVAAGREVILIHRSVRRPPGSGGRRHTLLR